MNKTFNLTFEKLNNKDLITWIQDYDNNIFNNDNISEEKKQILEQINKRSKKMRKFFYENYLIDFSENLNNKSDNNTYHYLNFFKKPESKNITNYIEISKREVMKRSDDNNNNNNLNKKTYNNEYRKNNIWLKYGKYNEEKEEESNKYKYKSPQKKEDVKNVYKRTQDQKYEKDSYKNYNRSLKDDYKKGNEDDNNTNKRINNKYNNISSVYINENRNVKKDEKKDEDIDKNNNKNQYNFKNRYIYKTETNNNNNNLKIKKSQNLIEESNKEKDKK